VCPERLSALTALLSSVGVSDVPVPNQTRTVYQRPPEPCFKSKFKNRYDGLEDIHEVMAGHWTASHSRVCAFLTLGAGSLEVVAVDWAHAARFDNLATLAGSAGIAFALLAGPKADSRCLEFVARCECKGDAEALVEKLVAERTYRQQRVAAVSCKLPHPLKLSQEHYIKFGGKSDGAALQKRLTMGLRQSDLEMRCKEEQLSVSIFTESCERRRNESLYSMERCLATMRTQKQERRSLLQAELEKILDCDFVKDLNSKGQLYWNVQSSKDDFILKGKGSATKLAMDIATSIRKKSLREALEKAFRKKEDGYLGRDLGYVHSSVLESMIEADSLGKDFVAHAKELSAAQDIANTMKGNCVARQLAVIQVANIDQFSPRKEYPLHLESCRLYVDLGVGTVEVAAHDLRQAVGKQRLRAMLKKQCEDQGFRTYGEYPKPTVEDVMKSLKDSDARFSNFLNGKLEVSQCIDLSIALQSEWNLRCHALRTAFEELGLRFKKGDDYQQQYVGRHWVLLGVGDPTEIARAKLQTERSESRKKMLELQFNRQHLPRLDYFVNMSNRIKKNNLMLQFMVEKLACKYRLPALVTRHIDDFAKFAEDSEFERFVIGDESNAEAFQIAARISTRFQEYRGQLVSSLGYDPLAELIRFKQIYWSPRSRPSPLQVVKRFCYFGYASSFSTVVEAAKRGMREIQQSTRKDKLQKVCWSKSCWWILREKNRRLSVRIDAFLSGETQSTAEEFVATILAECTKRQALITERLGKDFSFRQTWQLTNDHNFGCLPASALEFIKFGSEDDTATDKVVEVSMHAVEKAAEAALRASRKHSVATALSAAGLSKKLLLTDTRIQSFIATNDLGQKSLDSLVNDLGVERLRRWRQVETALHEKGANAGALLRWHWKPDVAGKGFRATEKLKSGLLCKRFEENAYDEEDEDENEDYCNEKEDDKNEFEEERDDEDEDDDTSNSEDSSMDLYDDFLGPDDMFVDRSYNEGRASRQLSTLWDYIELGQGSAAEAAAKLMECQRLQELLTALQCRGLMHNNSAADAKDLLRMMRLKIPDTQTQTLQVNVQRRIAQDTENSNHLLIMNVDDGRVDEESSEESDQIVNGTAEDADQSTVDQRKAMHEKLEQRSVRYAEARGAARRKVGAMQDILVRHELLPADTLLDKIEFEIDLQDVFSTFVKQWGRAQDYDEDDYGGCYFDDPLVSIGGLDPDEAAAYWESRD